MKLSESVRRLEDTIDSLRAENKKLRAERSDYEVDEKDEIIDHQKWDMIELKKEINRCKKLNDTLINNAKNDYEKYQKLEREL